VNFGILHKKVVYFMAFYENYLKLCEKAGKTPSAAALEMGLSKPTVNRWKKGGGATDATALKVASYFGVTVEELTGEEQKEKPTPSEGSGLDARFDALLSQMTDADRADLLEYMEFKVAKRKENPNG
jgi:transcriptional regulator with XRE-family HTH domain